MPKTPRKRPGKAPRRKGRARQGANTSFEKQVKADPYVFQQSLDLEHLADKFIRVRDGTDAPPLPGAPRLANVSGLRTAIVTPMPAPRAERAVPGKVYSSEVTAHANYLLKAFGKSEMENYLRSVKDMGESNGKEVLAGGNIESALEDAKRKESFYIAQAAIAIAERDRWHKIAHNLEEILDLATTPLNKQREPIGRKMSPRGIWKERFNNVMQSGPLSRTEIRNRLAKEHGLSFTSLYGPIAKAIESGQLKEESNGLLSLVQPN
jgi:hypothetical protein